MPSMSYMKDINALQKRNKTVGRALEMARSPLRNKNKSTSKRSSGGNVSFGRYSVGYSNTPERALIYAGKDIEFGGEKSRGLVFKKKDRKIKFVKGPYFE